ncbi:MAG TPA: diacylglycerol kinase family protein, partial [Thermodesulfovibrionales bacterium]|nr:diacylglycerol kinase family protein [Thermodesulfovibrionales bacterium]
MKSPILLIANPAARHASEKGIERAANLLRSGGWDVRVLFTCKKGDAEAFARHAQAEGISLIMAAGGDGTLNEVINGIVHTDVSMAILPMGTTNVLAKELGIPEDIEGAVNRALKGRPRAVSLGRITVGQLPSPLTRYFCLMAGIGFDGDAVYRFSTSLKRFSGKAAYILSGMKTLLHYSPEPLTFSMDGKSCRGYSAIICKAAR